MNKGRYYACISAVLVSIPCLAGDTIRLPTLQEGEWTLSTSAVTSDGQTFKTPASVLACLQPTSNMRRDLAQMEKQGCKTVSASSSDTEVRFTMRCPATRGGGGGEINVTLRAPDSRSFRQFVVTPSGTNEMQGRRLGPCKPEAKPTFDRHLDD